MKVFPVSETSTETPGSYIVQYDVIGETNASVKLGEGFAKFRTALQTYPISGVQTVSAYKLENSAATVGEKTSCKP